MDLDDYLSDVGHFELVQCSVCSRNFRTDVIDKHEAICLKTSKRKVKLFDSGKMRAKGTGIPLNKTIRPGEVVPREPDKDERIIRAEMKRDNWRFKHKEFISTIRSAKAYQCAISKGGNALLPPPPVSSVDPDLVQCPYCNRRFNESAAERHIPYCKDKSDRDRLKLQPNRTLKRPSNIVAAKSTDKRTTNQKVHPSPQKISKSPMTTNPRSTKTSITPNKPKDGSLSNTIRSLESTATSIKTPNMSNTRSSSVQKLSSKQSASSERDKKTPSRYGDFNPDRQLNKSSLNGLSTEVEDVCNSTFDLSDTLVPEISMKSMHGIKENERISVYHPQPSPESDFQHCKDYRTVSPLNVCINNTKNSSTLRKMSSDILEQEELLPKELQFHQHLADLSFVSDQIESHLPTRTTSKRSSCFSECIESHKQISMMSGHNTRKPKLENYFDNPITHQDQIDPARVDRIGNREDIVEMFSKLGKVNRRRMAAQESGILVRAVNVSARREPQVGRQSSQTQTSSKALHCHECGTKYPSTTARFCPECGVRKMTI